MDHNLTAEWKGFRLRPVKLADAAFIVWLRHQPHTQGFIGEGAPDVAAQEGWLQAYFQRPDDYYFIVERVSDGERIGAVGIYNFANGGAEWGRWVLIPGSKAAWPSAWMTFHIGFEVLGLKCIRGWIVEHNQKVFAVHEKLGFRFLGFEPQTQIVAGKEVRMMAIELPREDWPAVSARLDSFCSPRP